MRQYSLAIVIVALFCWVSSQGQDTRVSRFIDDVYTDIVPPGYRYYYLADTSCSSVDIAAFFEDPKTVAYVARHDATFATLTRDSFIAEDKKVSWKTYSLSKAVVLPRTDLLTMVHAGNRIIALVDERVYRKHKDSLDRVRAYNEIFVPVNFSWSKKKIRAIMNRYADTLEAMIPPEKEYHFTFSKPVFSRDHQYALAYLGNNDSICLNVYKYRQGRWKKIATTFVMY